MKPVQKEGDMAHAVLTQPGSGDRLTVLIGSEESAGARFRFEYLARGVTAAPGNHVHADQEESVEVLSGELRCRVGGEEHRLHAGESIVIPAGTPHAVWNAHPGGCRSVGEFRPARDTEAFFGTFFVPVTPEQEERMSKVSHIPAGYHSVTPFLVLEHADEAIEFYTRAFGAKERMRMPGPDGKIAHAELQIGDSIVMLTEAQHEPVTAASLYLYVPNVDEVVARAKSAGAQVAMPPTDMFWGDRFGRVVDPFGVRWGLATHQEDVSADETARRAAQVSASA
jgi:PhnB protein